MAVLDELPPGLLDPKTAGMLQAAFGMMQASGPSRTPVSLGQVIGQGGQQGLGAYQQQMQQMLAHQRQQVAQQHAQNQLAEQKRFHDMQNTRFAADAEKDRQAVDLQKKQTEYLSQPHIKQLILSNKYDEVLSGLPGLSPTNIINRANNMQPKAKEESPLARLRREMAALPTDDVAGRAEYATRINKEIHTPREITPTTIIPPPVTSITVQDKSSPTGWSHADARTGRITAKGAPSPSSDPTNAGAKRDAINASDQRKASAQDQRGALLALKAAGYDPSSGGDALEALIEKSTSGAVQSIAAEGLAAVNISTSGRKALNTLKSAANKITLELMDRKLGAGISNADRDFIVQQLGDVGNSMKTADERLAAWRYAKSRMIDIGMLSTSGGGGGGGAPGLPTPDAIEAELARRQQGGR